MKILLLFFFTSCSNFNKNKELTLKQIDKNSEFLKKIENLSSQKQNYQEPFKNFVTKTIPEFLHRNTNGFALQKSLPDLKNFDTTSSDITISTLIEILDL